MWPAPPSLWTEIPAYVREVLARPFEKQADGLPVVSQLADILGWKAGPINSAWGGPRPVANLLIGGGLGALGGYGVGRIAESILPKKYFRDGALRRRATILGGAITAAPAMWQTYDSVRNDGAAGPFLPYPPPAGEDQLAKASNFSLAAAGYAGTTKRGSFADGIFDPTIDKSIFSQSVMGDQSTPMAIRAMTSGLLEAADAVGGNRGFVSPWDVGRIAVGAGGGLVSGLIAGKALSLLAGLSQEGQDKVKEIGMWSGLLRKAVPTALGLR